MTYDAKKFGIFDIHGHLNGTIPGIVRIFNRKMPKDVKLSDFKKAGARGGVVCVLGDPNTFGIFKKNTYRYVLNNIEKIRSEIRKVNASFAIDSSALSAAFEDGTRPAFVIGIEGADFVEDDVGRLDAVHDLGVRLITLIHYTDNSIGAKCMSVSGEEGKAGGLTEIGEKAVERMNDLGIVTDVAHANEKTAFSAVEASAKPVVCSHTGPRALQDFPRFISDDLIKAIAKKGGLVGMWGFLKKSDGVRDLKMFSEYTKHVADVAGIDRIAIGTDFNGVPGNMEGYSNIHDYGSIVKALLENGFSESDVARICHKNFLEFFREFDV